MVANNSRERKPIRGRNKLRIEVGSVTIAGAASTSLFWHRFNATKTRALGGLKLFRTTILNSVINYTVPATCTDRDVIEQIARQASIQIPIESLACELEQKVHVRGMTCFGFPGDYFDRIARNYDQMHWWVSKNGLNMEAAAIVSLSPFDALAGKLMFEARRPGDLWKLNKHRLFCGNALQEASFTKMSTRRADLVFSDPPFNLKIDGHVGGKGAIHHREFAMASGEMNAAEFTVFLTTGLRLLSRFSSSASVHFICMDWRHIGELLAAANQVYSELLNLCIWVKNAGGMGSLYRSRHELVFVFRNGKGRHQNNVMLGKYHRDRTNVWEYPGINTLSRQGDEGNLLALHPTCKPVNLVADAILDCSARGDIVLDSFLGSGTTLIAAERVSRICHGMELDPRYVDVAIRRWQKHTGDRAIHAETGEPFDERAAQMEASHGR
jgi:DNA modification methylase